MQKLVDSIVNGLLDQIKGKEVSALELAQELFDYLMGLGGGSLKELYKQIDEQIDRSDCPVCQGPTENRGKKKKRYRTRFGLVAVRRRGRYCPSCQKGFYLLDEVVGVEPKETETADFKELVCFHTQLSGSFEDTIKRLKHDYRIEIEESQVGRILGKVNQAITPTDRQSAQPLLDGQRAYIGMDGILVRTREAGKKFHEIKNGVIFTTVALVGKERKELLDKSYVSTAAATETFQQRLQDECASRGVFAAPEIVINGDGAEFIKTVAASGQLGWIEKFGSATHQKITKILDPKHLLDKFKERFRQMCGSKAKAEALTSECFDLVWQAEDASGLETVLKKVNACRPSREQGKEAKRRLLGYLERNRDWIVPYKKYREAGYIVSAGFIESGNQTVVAKRMKNKKARWLAKGAENLVDLRVLYLNDKWAAFFLTLSAVRMIFNRRQVTHRWI